MAKSFLKNAVSAVFHKVQFSPIFQKQNSIIKTEFFCFVFNSLTIVLLLHRLSRALPPVFVLSLLQIWTNYCILSLIMAESMHSITPSFLKPNHIFLLSIVKMLLIMVEYSPQQCTFLARTHFFHIIQTAPPTYTACHLSPLTLFTRFPHHPNLHSFNQLRYKQTTPSSTKHI